MTETMTPGNPAFTYVRVADAIAVRIVGGHYTGRLPAQRDLAQEFGVAYATLRRAVVALHRRNLVISPHGCGTIVAPWVKPVRYD
jgi:DNA-binding GntR family transcriptional regulator